MVKLEGVVVMLVRDGRHVKVLPTSKGMLADLKLITLRFYFTVFKGRQVTAKKNKKKPPPVHG